MAIKTTIYTPEGKLKPEEAFLSPATDLLCQENDMAILTYMKKIIGLILLGFLPTILFGQSFLKEKRIYLLDVTASMIGNGVVETPNIFDVVKSNLTETIQAIQGDDDEIVIIPFTSSTFNPIRGIVSQKDSIIEEISRIVIQHGDTNIDEAYRVGIHELDSTKVNYLFLLTDGLHNHGVEKEVLYKDLASWGELSAGHYMFAFYVMLTPNAKEQEISKVIEETNQMWLIESMNVNAVFVNTSMNISANVNDNHTIKIVYTTSNHRALEEGINISIKLEDNDFYRLSNYTVDYLQNTLVFTLEELKPRIEIPLELDLSLSISYDRDNYPLVFFTPEIINFQIINKGVRTMKISER